MTRDTLLLVLATAWILGGIAGLDIGGPWQAAVLLLPGFAVLGYVAHKQETRS